MGVGASSVLRAASKDVIGNCIRVSGPHHALNSGCSRGIESPLRPGAAPGAVIRVARSCEAIQTPVIRRASVGGT